MKQLRDYQVKSIDNMARKVAAGIRRIVYQQATGSGKTITFAGLSKRFLAAQPGKILILVHKEELLMQAYRTLFQWYEIVAIPVQSGTTYLPQGRVNIAMVETANNRLKKNPNYFGKVSLVIVDECHIGNFKKLYDFFPQAIIIGFTATPISSSRKDPLKNYFDDIVCGIDIPELIDIWKADHTQGLVPNKTICISSVNRKTLSIKNGEFDDRQMAEEYSNTKHVQNCVVAYRQHCMGRKTIVFNCSIEHSKKVNAAFLAFGYPSKHLDGETPEYDRKTILKWYKETPGAILNNVGVLTTGFDEPSIEAGIINRSTKSEPLWLQMCGRMSRPYPGKEQFLILDMGGNGAELGDWSEPRDWKEIFFNPPKPGDAGEAPSKECRGCHVLIHASIIICPHCGFENKRMAVYDAEAVSFQNYAGRKPPDIYVEDLIKQNMDKKPLYVLFKIRNTITGHVRHKWRLKGLNDELADQIMTHYLQAVFDWCMIGKEKFGRFSAKEGEAFAREIAWHQKMARGWMEEDFAKYFNWQRSVQKIA